MDDSEEWLDSEREEDSETADRIWDTSWEAEAELEEPELEEDHQAPEDSEELEE